MYSDNMGASVLRNGRKMQDSLPLWQGSGDRSAPGCTSRRGRPAPGLPQRQENAGSAAVVARGGGPGCHGKHLSQGTASSGASTTAGKCRIRCRCGKGRRTEVPRDAPPAGVGQSLDFRNGRKMRMLLPLWQGAEERRNMERRYFIGHSSRRASDGRIPETFHTETRAARIFIINTAAATAKVTASADRNPEVRTGHGARVSAAG